MIWQVLFFTHFLKDCTYDNDGNSLDTNDEGKRGQGKQGQPDLRDSYQRLTMKQYLSNRHADTHLRHQRPESLFPLLPSLRARCAFPVAIPTTNTAPASSKWPRPSASRIRRFLYFRDA